MVFGAITLTFSDLAVQIIVGALAAALTGRVMRGAGFGLLGDLLFGIIGAVVANFAVSYFSLLNYARYGLPGEIAVAAIGAILLVVVLHLVTGRRTTRASV